MVSLQEGGGDLLTELTLGFPLKFKFKFKGDNLVSTNCVIRTRLAFLLRQCDWFLKEGC